MLLPPFLLCQFADAKGVANAMCLLGVTDALEGQRAVFAGTVNEDVTATGVLGT